MTAPVDFAIPQDGSGIVPRGTNPKDASLWSEDAERAVLAAILIDGRAADAVAPVLQADHFYRGPHRVLFTAMQALRRAGTTIDPVTLANQLESTGELASAGGREILAELCDEVPTAANVGHHAQIVRAFARRRGLLTLGMEITRQARDLAVPIEEAFDRAGQALMEQSAGASEKGFRHVKEEIWATMERIDGRRQGTAPTGLQLGWPELDDRMHGGFEPGTLCVVVGVPSSGKTTFILNGLTNLAYEGKGTTAMVSAEMTRPMLIEAMLAAHGDVPRAALKTGDLTPEQARKLGQAAARLVTVPIFTDDEVMPDIEDVVNRCTLLKARHPDLCAVGVDFIQLLQRRHKERGELHEATLRHIAYALKSMALRLKLVVFATAQPNDKQIEDREDKRPQLRDIQGSSGIRQAADVIALIYRPGQYSASAGDAFEINLGKNKFGPVGLATLLWEGPYVRVTSPRRRQLELQAKKERERPLDLMREEG